MPVGLCAPVISTVAAVILSRFLHIAEKLIVLQLPLPVVAMSNNAYDAQKQTPPSRARHQITRSISEVSSPIRLHRHHHAPNHRAKDRDDKTSVPQSAAPSPPTRGSLEGTRLEAYTPSMSANPSRRASVHLSNDDMAVQAASPGHLVSRFTMEEHLAMELDRGAARTAYGPAEHFLS